MADDEPGGTLAWAGSILLLSVLMLGFTALFAAPAFLALSGDPFASGLAALIVVYLSMRTIRNVSADAVEESVSTVNEIETGRQLFVFFMAMLTLSIAVTSVHVGVLAAAFTWIASLLPSTPAVGLALPAAAILTSALDAWLGREYGVSLSSAGLYLGMAVMYVVALTVQADQSSVDLAGDELYATYFGSTRPRLGSSQPGLR